MLGFIRNICAKPKDPLPLETAKLPLSFGGEKLNIDFRSLSTEYPTQMLIDGNPKFGTIHLLGQKLWTPKLAPENLKKVHNQFISQENLLKILQDFDSIPMVVEGLHTEISPEMQRTRASVLKTISHELKLKTGLGVFGKIDFGQVFRGLKTKMKSVGLNPAQSYAILTLGAPVFLAFHNSKLHLLPGEPQDLMPRYLGLLKRQNADNDTAIKNYLTATRESAVCTQAIEHLRKNPGTDIIIVHGSSSSFAEDRFKVGIEEHTLPRVYKYNLR